MFNLSAEDLFYKWEAFDFNSSSTRSFSSFTADSAKALKSQLQRDLANEMNRNIRAKPALPANRRRDFDTKFVGTNLGRTDGTLTGGPSIKLIPRTGIAGGSETLMNSIVSSNKISFKGPRNDPICRRSRACQSLNLCYYPFKAQLSIPRQVHV
jgi:DNA polymerase alpha subunit B